MRRVLDELDEARRDPRRTGVAVGLAAGLAVAAPVARTFLGFGPPLEDGLAWALPLAGLAFACTTAGTIVAVRARSTGVAVAWSFVANVIPPTLVCLPSVIGLVFSVPSGLAAFVVTLPLVLYARHSAARAPTGHPERERIAGTILLVLVALGLLVYEVDYGTNTYRWHASYVVPALVAAGGATAFALGALLPDLYRAWLRTAVATGRVDGLRLTEDGVVERFDSAGEGPMRTAATRDALGRLSASRARLACGLVVTALAAVALAASVWALGLAATPPYPY